MRRDAARGLAVWAALCAALLAGCDDGAAGGPETAPDAEVTAADAAGAEPDAGIDAAPEPEPDAAPDTAEPEPDAAPDLDAAPEPEPDAARDLDAAPEPEPDAAPEPDAWLRPGVAPGSPFGIGTSAARARNLAWLAPIAETGITWLRGFDRGNAAASLDAAEAAGFRVTGILQTGDTFPLDLDAWQAHVSGLVEATADRVRWWEVWNEPPNFSVDKSPANYAALVVRAFDTIRAIDPDIRVGLAAASVHLEFMDQALRAGAAGHFDYITLHPYETLGLVDRGFEPLFMAIVPTVRAMLRARDPERADVPIVFTEIGEPVNDRISPAHQAQTFIKAYVMSIAQGVSRVHWFEGQDGDSGPFGLIANDGTRRPSFTAARVLVERLGAEPRYEGWLHLDGRHPGFAFTADDGPVLIAWTGPGLAVEHDFGAEVEAVDPLTDEATTGPRHTLTPSPLIVRRAPAGLIAEARANRGRPYPWGGDYTGAAEVRFDAPGLEAGLHPLGAAPTRVFGDVEARDHSQGAGHAFAVDPNFLTYDAVPLRVTAVVRRNGPDNAGFNLKYESVTGYRGTGAWTTVPAGDDWHTITWDIDDPMFVGKWGYHLALDSDATRFSGYSLRALTVSRR